jgi:hypothetical protein
VAATTNDERTSLRRDGLSEKCASLCELPVISFQPVTRRNLQGGKNANTQAFTFLAYRGCVARSYHGGCENVTYDVRPVAQWKDRRTANYENPRPDDDIGADGNGVRCISRQLHRRNASVAFFRLAQEKEHLKVQVA